MVLFYSIQQLISGDLGTILIILFIFIILLFVTLAIYFEMKLLIDIENTISRIYFFNLLILFRFINFINR